MPPNCQDLPPHCRATFSARVCLIRRWPPLSSGRDIAEQRSNVKDGPEADRVAFRCARIAEIHRRSRETYGAPRIHAELREQGLKLGCNRVARLMRAAGLRGASRRSWMITTVRDRQARPAPDLVERDFSAPAPNRLWVADITYIPTWAGFLYLVVVLDAFSRRIVGWAMETYLRTELMLKALDMALGQRRAAGVIHH